MAGRLRRRTGQAAHKRQDFPALLRRQRLILGIAAEGAGIHVEDALAVDERVRSN